MIGNDQLYVLCRSSSRTVLYTCIIVPSGTYLNSSATFRTGHSQLYITRSAGTPSTSQKLQPNLTPTFPLCGGYATVCECGVCVGNKAQLAIDMNSTTTYGRLLSWQTISQCATLTNRVMGVGRSRGSGQINRSRRHCFPKGLLYPLGTPAVLFFFSSSNLICLF
jgi:hypothetical protein